MTAALFKRIMYLIATVLTVAILFLTMYLPQGVWLLASVFLFLNISLDTSLQRRTLVIAVAGAASLGLIFIGTLLAPFALAQVILFTSVTGYCVYMGARRGKAAYPWFVVNFMGVLTIHADGTLASALSHTQAALAGIGVVVAAQIILLPYFNRDEYRRCKIQVLKSLSRLSETVFACLILPEYSDNIYSFERRIHKQKIKCLTSMALLAQREQAAAASSLEVRKLQTLFEMLVDIGQIRRRVTDHTVFSLCTDEMKGIDLAIKDLFTAFAGGDGEQQEAALLALGRYITQLESTFEHILRVTAREPLVFVLMLGSLKTLVKQCREQLGVTAEYAEVIS